MSDTAYKATKASDRLKFRTSTRLLFFELPQYYKWYLQRVDEPNREVLHDYMSMITRGIAPVVPHMAEEAWSLLDEEGFVINQQFPKGKESDIGFLIGEDLIKQTLEDTKAILNIAKIEKPTEIVLITSPKWKWDAVQTAGELADGRGQVKLNQLIGNVMPNIPNESKKVGAEFLKKWVLKDIPSLGPEWQERYKVKIDEKAILESSIDFFSKVFDCPVSVINAEKAVSRLEPKSKQSAPLRPAIFVS
jgi:leucyl-tRNA synthetase